MLISFSIRFFFLDLPNFLPVEEYLNGPEMTSAFPGTSIILDNSEFMHYHFYMQIIIAVLDKLLNFIVEFDV